MRSKGEQEKLGKWRAGGGENGEKGEGETHKDVGVEGAGKEK